jgi:hypothetical protein
MDRVLVQVLVVVVIVAVAYGLARLKRRLSGRDMLDRE